MNLSFASSPKLVAGMASAITLATFCLLSGCGHPDEDDKTSTQPPPAAVAVASRAQLSNTLIVAGEFEVVTKLCARDQLIVGQPPSRGRSGSLISQKLVLQAAQKGRPVMLTPIPLTEQKVCRSKNL